MPSSLAALRPHRVVAALAAAAAAWAVLVAPAAAEPLQHSAMAPPDGLSQLAGPIDWQMSGSLTALNPAEVVISTSPATDADGVLVNRDAGSVSLLERGGVGSYQRTAPGPAQPGTYYWQVRAEWHDAAVDFHHIVATPVRQLVIQAPPATADPGPQPVTPTPPATGPAPPTGAQAPRARRVSIRTAEGLLIGLIHSNLGNHPPNLRERCRQVGNRVRCAPRWSTSRFSYQGTVTFSDGGTGVAGTLTGQRASRTCVTRRRSFSRCSPRRFTWRL